MHDANEVVIAGKKPENAGKAIIMLHGRGAGAEDMIHLASELDLEGFSLLIPQARRNTWYPYSFLEPEVKNQPWLESALALISELKERIYIAGIATENIYFCGFSQGACLSLEYAARNAERYGGVIAFSGGLIGERIDKSKYSGDFSQTPVYMGCSDPDPHIPVDRVRESYGMLKNMNAEIHLDIFPNMGHTINWEEIEKANRILNSGH